MEAYVIRNYPYRYNASKNDPPIIPDTTVTTKEDTPITVCLPITDVDAGDTHVSVIGYVNPSHGTVTAKWTDSRW